MRINYYFREQTKTAFSIENVFRSVQQGLPSTIDYKEYFAASSFDIRFLRKIRNLQADIHHVTGAINYAAMALPASATVLTVHDLGHLTNTLKGARKWLYKKLFWDQPVKKLKYLTAISEFTRQQLLRETDVKPNAVRTIHNPVSKSFAPVALKGHDRPVILQIGGGANKNIDCLLEAVESLSCKLILVRMEDPGIVDKLNKRKIDFEFRSRLSEKELADAYADCDMLYFASSYEGFGLPIIEAMASGRPVITSAIEPMMEVAGSAACLVNYKDSGDVRRAIVRITQSADYRNQLIEHGMLRAKAFSIEKIAGLYNDLYEEIVKNG